MTELDLLREPWAFGPWCWVIDDVQLLPEPVAARGMNGLWPVREAAVLRALEAANLRCLFGQKVQAITLQQPFASAVAIGPKRIENRPNRINHLAMLGRYLVLHAGKTVWGGDKFRTELMMKVWRRPSPQLELKELPSWSECPALDDMPRGVVLGVIRIRECLKYPGSPS